MPYVSPEVKRLMCDKVAILTRQGLTAGQIADRLGVTTRTVVRYRNRTGVSQKTSGLLTQQEIDLAKSLLDDGCSYEETARTVRCSASTLKRRFPGKGMTFSEGAKLRYLYLR